MVESLTIKVKSNLSLGNAGELKRELTDALNNGIKSVVLDFAGTELVDSSGLGKLLLFSEKFKEIGGELKIVKVGSKDVAELFRLINLARFIKIDYQC